MTRVALRGIRSHPGRFLLSILAVLLGVAFVAGTFSLRAMMSATFDDIIESGTNADTYLRGSTIEATGGDAMTGFAGSARFPIEIVDAIAEADGVAGEIREVEVVGEVGFAAPMAGAIMVGLDMETAMAAYAPDGTVDLVGVYAEDGVSQTDLATSVKATLAGVPGTDSVEVLTGDQMRDDGREQWQSMLGFISTFLLVFAGIALFVGTFIISNTFA